MDKFFCILSLSLYFVAPNQYSFTYCIVLFLLMLVNMLYMLKMDKEFEIMGFNSVFSCSLILVTYIYPLFIYQVLPNYSLFVFGFNEAAITKASAMVDVAYSMYALGYMQILRNDLKSNLVEKRKTFVFPRLISRRRLLFFTEICVLLFLMVIITGGLTQFESQYRGGTLLYANGLFGLLWVFFQPFCIILVITNVYYNRKVTNIVLGIIICALMAVGTRTLPLCVILVFIYAFCIRRNYTIKQISIIGFTAFIFLSLAGRFRSGNVTMSDITSNEVGIWNYFEDFIVCTRNQYAIYDYVQRHGTTNGISSLGYILSVIPYGQSAVSSLFGLSGSDLRSETLTTIWAGADSGLGLGTHIVGDVYLAFGLVGVILLFYMLGYIVAKSRRYMFMGSARGTVVYLVLLSGAIFMCRGSYFYSLKNIVWSLIIISLFGVVYKRKVL